MKIKPITPEKPVLNQKRKTVHFKCLEVEKEQEVPEVPAGYYLYCIHPGESEGEYYVSDKRTQDTDGILITNYDVLENIKHDIDGVRTVNGYYIDENYDMEFDAYLDIEIDSVNSSLPEILKRLLENNLIFQHGEPVGVERDNYYHFVEFIRNQRFGNSMIPTGEEVELPHCREQFALLIEEMENMIPELSNKTEKYALQDSVKWGKMYLKGMYEEPWNVQYINLYNLILKNWDYIKSFPCTYLILIDLIALEEKWCDNTEEKTEIFQLMRDMNYEWEWFRG